jgi:hypothetical protein
MDKNVSLHTVCYGQNNSVALKNTVCMMNIIVTPTSVAFEKPHKKEMF